jgi:large subunit ribosomal protein L18
MAKNKTRYAARKRRHLRVRTKVHGVPERPRMNVFRSLNEIYVQIIDDESGKTLVSASTIDHELRSEMVGLTKTEQAKLVGTEIAKRAKDAGIKTVVFDRGGYKYIGRVKALSESAREGGLEF